MKTFEKVATAQCGGDANASPLQRQILRGGPR